MSDRRLGKHLFIFGIVIVIIAAIAVFFLLQISPVKNPDSTQRFYIDQTLKNLIIVGAIVFILIFGSMIYTVLFFRKDRGDETDGPPIKGNSTLEVIWTVIPLLIVIGVGVYGAHQLDIITKPAPSVLNINVTAYRWTWEFDYPDTGVHSYYLELPVNQPVLFHLHSNDVIHGFWIPEFGQKQDVVPGLNLTLQLTPTKTGVYTLRCSQLCGLGHANMIASVYVVSQGEFQDWQKQHAPSATTSTPPSTTVTTTSTPTTTSTSTTFQTLASHGGSVYSSTCSVCHGNNGQGGIGPALWGSNATLGTYKGTTLFNKNAQDMLNFISTKMPLTAPGSLSSEQYVNVLCYILIQNNLVSPSKVFDETQLSSITLG